MFLLKSETKQCLFAVSVYTISIAKKVFVWSISHALLDEHIRTCLTRVDYGEYVKAGSRNSSILKTSEPSPAT